MKLHLNDKDFAQAVQITSIELGIPVEFVEKDYWICQILQRLSRHEKAERIVWKGGTSLTKGYRLIKRFSSDVDFAVITEGLGSNQKKQLVLRIGKDTTIDLTEIEDNVASIKNSRFRKTYHAYPSCLTNRDTKFEFLGNHVIVEINTYGNPYPFVKLEVTPFITEMMEKRGLNNLIGELDMEPFTLKVLDKRRTLCEKMVSLIRFSFEEDGIKGLSSKIRHFYDLHFLLQDEECQKYLTGEYPTELKKLIAHDKREFDRPPLWRGANILTSLLFTDFDATWRQLSSTYKSEVGALSYGELPSADAIAESMKQLLSITRKAIGN